jgi:dihydropteroate synthase
MENKSPRWWEHRTGESPLGARTLLMGIVNVTPDSFSDGGQCFEPEAAIAHALQLQKDGADFLDIGAESTRPGSDPVPVAEQLRRLLPVMKGIAGRVQIPVSIDTRFAEVAEPCLQAGASIINDVTALRSDARLAEVCARFHAGLVLMHMRGGPKTMQRDTHYDDLIGEIHSHLQQAMERASVAGVSPAQIIVDPGIGFGKSFEQNYLILGGLHTFRNIGSGLLVGPSRKAFTGQFSDKPANRRQFATAAAVALAALGGADIIRVHDVAEMREVLDIVDYFRTLHESVPQH